MEAITVTAERSNLLLDPVLTTHNLINALTTGLPTLIENTGQARGFGSGVVAQGRVTPQAHLRLALLGEKIGAAQRTLAAEMGRIFEESAALAPRLRAASDRAVGGARAFLELTDRQLLAADPIRIEASRYFDAGTEAIAASLALYDAALPILDALLAERSAAASRTELASYAILSVVLSLVVYLLTGLYLGIEGNLLRMGEAAQRLADGDLTVRLDLPTRDEMAQIGTAFNVIAEGLGNSLHAVHGANDQLATVATQMLRASQQTADGVERQMTEIEQAATAIHEMAAAVQEVARNTVQAAESADHADAAATTGQGVVEEAVAAIHGLAAEVQRVADAIEVLERESAQVSGVLEVIRGIAEQTNLLALNAAIEAARAGDQGRGFAVVADEVRNLAQRTQQSTVEIQAMIERLQRGAHNAVQAMRGSGEQAALSVECAAGAGDALRSITTAVATISGMSTQIATASQEQSAVSEEINRNIGNVTRVAEQTALDAQQSTAASAQVAALASEMNLLLKRFKIDEELIAEQRRHGERDVLFKWDDSFRVGVDEVDRQHHRLVELVNELHREMSGRRGTEALGRILEGVVDYTKNHFAYEEKLMREHGYPQFQEHRAGHEKLTAQVLEFQRRFAAGDANMLSTLLAFLCEWLTGHIKGADRAFGPFLNEKGLH
jgi:hemerythrin-like metal-binding protein